MALILDSLPSPTASWTEICAAQDEADPRLRSLSPAERVVVRCLGQGLSNREIAAALGKSEATVKNQVSSCLHKLAVPTRARLIATLR